GRARGGTARARQAVSQDALDARALVPGRSALARRIGLGRGGALGLALCIARVRRVAAAAGDREHAAREEQSDRLHRRLLWKAASFSPLALPSARVGRSCGNSTSARQKDVGTWSPRQNGAPRPAVPAVSVYARQFAPRGAKTAGLLANRPHILSGSGIATCSRAAFDRRAPRIPMKSTFAAFAAALLLTVAGCGGEQEDLSPPYPP